MQASYLPNESGSGFLAASRAEGGERRAISGARMPTL